jgi:ribose 5-phosphate isomerase A
MQMRLGLNKAGPLITDNGNFVLDWKPDATRLDRDRPGWSWRMVHEDIKMISGVVETGLCIDMATHVYFGMPDGTVTVRHRVVANTKPNVVDGNLNANDLDVNGDGR